VFADQIRREDIEHKDNLIKLKIQEVEKEKEEIKEELKIKYEHKLKKVENEKNEMQKQLEYYKKMLQNK
jgi:hypothetical protein